MGRRRPTLPLFLLCATALWPSSAFLVPPSQSAASAISSFHRRLLVPLHAKLDAKTEEDRPDDSDGGCGVVASPPVLTTTTSRRSAILAAGAAAILPFINSSSDAAHAATADDESLTTQLFNPDGSLRDASAAQEAKSRPVTATFPGGDGSTTTTTSLVSVDGEGPISASDSADSSSKSGKVTVTYRIPDKWGPPSTGYLDKSEGVNARAADRITVYQTPYPAVVKTLDKASMTGVAKALGIETVPNYNPSLLSADLISGRRDAKRGDGNVYYEFDLAVAPQNCASGTKEDLGLGFCPYDSIVLLGATVVDGRMYGIMVECGREEWKRGSADLKRVRSSFLVEGQLELLDK